MHLPAITAAFVALTPLPPSLVYAATPITYVAIYRGPAGGDDCSESVQRALQRLSPIACFIRTGRTLPKRMGIALYDCCDLSQR
ncbi:hypothetical protein SAMN04490179_2868 [Pseudomonas antarctica]|uniref:Uncharacterized protein n=1 Tax=Pseudomonas antarctica TaxID=219572 RepID=A0A1G9Z4Q3_9PSED|nr:hypothetical protein PSAN_34440 [Pseudomonas antarctica]SDN16362.1 hypothetical protein SAMN04490179_2868 [Pseudomonas antarctica]